MQPSRIYTSLFRPTVRRVTKAEINGVGNSNQPNKSLVSLHRTSNQTLIPDQNPIRKLSNNIQQSQNNSLIPNCKISRTSRILSRANHRISPDPASHNGIPSLSATKFSFTSEPGSDTRDDKKSEKKKRRRFPSCNLAHRNTTTATTATTTTATTATTATTTTATTTTTTTTTSTTTTTTTTTTTSTTTTT
ncbi:unnamed protein product, partial [Rotaria socialis]